MRYTILFSIFLFAILPGCSKKKFGSTPTLKFKSVNTTQLNTGQLLQFTLAFTDAEGDLTDSIYVDQVVPNCPASSVATYYALPPFPASKNQDGDIIITFGYNAGSGYTNISPQCQQNDTATFRFALRDKALHVSDTVSSPKIILYY
jgi:hypothetical protein